jgi:hypothetical protein
MNRQVVIEDGTRYTIALDDDIPVGDRVWGVVQARLIDELTGATVSDRVILEAAGSGLSGRRARSSLRAQVAMGGVVGLVGIPSAALPALRTVPYEVGLSIKAPGYLQANVTQPIGPQPTFPQEFAQADLGDIELHRDPMVVRGRVVRRLGTGELVPLSGATVRITGIWRTVPPANLVVPPLTPDIASLSPPLYSDRIAGGCSVNAVTVTPAVGQDKELLAATGPGSTVLRLSDQLGLNPSGIVMIDDGDPGLLELVRITAITGASDPALPATIAVAHPLARSHSMRAVVRPVAIALQAPMDTLAVDAITGDTTLLLASSNTLGGPAFVEVSGGPNGLEYHALTPYTTTSNADGYYRLPPLSRVAQLSLEAQQLPFVPVPRTISPNYSVREQIVDLIVE